MSNIKLMSVCVSGYKGFLAPARIDLSSLTLVFGENSAGKSSLMRLLVAIAKAVRDKSVYPLVPVSDADEVCGFVELLSTSSGTMRVELDFGADPIADFTLAYEIKFIREKNEASILKMTCVSAKGVNFAFSYDLDGEVGVTAGESYFLSQGEGGQRVQLCFEGLAPVLVSQVDSVGADVKRVIDHAYEALAAFSLSLYWIGPLRAVPQRNIRLVLKPTKISCDGREIPQLLHPTYRQGGDIVGLVSAWYQDATGRVLSVDAQVVNGRDDVFNVYLAPSDAPAQTIPIADHGAGMAQCLPIIVLCALAQVHRDQAFVLVFENPELHLHDAVHEYLARIFIQTITINPNVQIIAETHSENLLLATQLSIVEGVNAEDRERISVNWVKKSPSGGGVVERYGFDERGSLGGLWSKTIFGYTTQLARKIIEARMKITGGQ